MRYAPKIALALASLILGSALCELALSLWHPQLFRRPPVWRYDPELGWSHVPDRVGRLVTPEFDVEMRINSTGLRDREFAGTKAAGVRRVALFGDSFVEGWGVPIEVAVSRQLEACLRQEKAAVEVANFGVAGYGTDQALLFFEQQGPRFGADEVVLFFYGNDLWNNASRRGIGAERGFKPYFRVRGNGRLVLAGVPVKKSSFWQPPADSWPLVARLDQYFSQHWHVYRLLQKAWQPAVPRGQQQDFYAGLYGADARFVPAWALTGRILAAFKRSVEQRGARLTVVYVPSIVQVEEDNWRAKRDLYGLIGEFDLRKPNAQLAGFAEQHGFALLDLLDEFREKAQHQTLYWRDSHWNAAGHALAAERLCAHLRRP